MKIKIILTFIINIIIIIITSLITLFRRTIVCFALNIDKISHEGMVVYRIFFTFLFRIL